MEKERIKHHSTNPKTIRVEAHVLKNRNGELATVKLDFTSAWSDFADMGKEGLDYDKALGE